MVHTTLPKEDDEQSSRNFEEIYKANQPLVYRFMFWRTKDDMLAEDLTSHVFEKAWRTRASFVGGSSKAWVFRIARTTLIDHWRKQKDVTANDDEIEKTPSDQRSLDETTDLTLSTERLKMAVESLPFHMRRIVELRFIEGRSTRQTSKELGMSEANVRVIQYRALQKLRKKLEK